MFASLIARFRSRFNVTGKELTCTRSAPTAEELQSQLDALNQAVGERSADLPSRTPASTHEQINEMKYRYFVCSSCRRLGKVRTFRTKTVFVDHLKNYHGAKDGDDIERLF